MPTNLPLEIERKFLIEYPDTARLFALADGDVSSIVQTYLQGAAGASERVRARTKNGTTVYTYNSKIKLSDMKRIEEEREISAEEYQNLLTRADPACRPIEKTRYVIRQNGFAYEVDVFPFWDAQAFLEVELPQEDTTVPMPDFVKVIREVTFERGYTNHDLAKKLAGGKKRN